MFRAVPAFVRVLSFGRGVLGVSGVRRLLGRERVARLARLPAGLAFFALTAGHLAAVRGG